MNIVIQDDDDTDHDAPSISLETVRAAIAAGITPKWWSYSVYPNGTIDVTDALSAFAQRVDAFADIVVEGSDDDALKGVGLALGELADEAVALVGIARESKTQQAPTEAPSRDDSQVEPLLKRYLRRLTDVYPFHLAVNLYGMALNARSGDLAELERCVIELEGAAFPGWPSGEIVSRASDEGPEACRADLPQTKLAELLSIAYRSNRVMKHNLVACYLELMARDHDKARSFDMGWTLEGLHETATAGYEALIAAGQAIGVDENDLARFLDADDLNAMSEQGVAAHA